MAPELSWRQGPRQDVARGLLATRHALPNRTGSHVQRVTEEGATKQCVPAAATLGWSLAAEEGVTHPGCQNS